MHICICTCVCTYTYSKNIICIGLMCSATRQVLACIGRLTVLGEHQRRALLPQHFLYLSNCSCSQLSILQFRSLIVLGIQIWVLLWSQFVLNVTVPSWIIYHLCDNGCSKEQREKHQGLNDILACIHMQGYLDNRHQKVCAFPFACLFVQWYEE